MGFPDWRISLGMMWLVGISFGINDLIPYILISRYHNSLIFRLKAPVGTERQFGVDCAMIVGQIYFSQLFMSIILGPIIGAWDSSVVIFLVTSIAALIGVFVTLFVLEYEI